MYLPTATTNGVTLFGGGWSERRSGVGISDTAGAFAAGTLAPTSSDKTLTAGISGSYDAAHLVGANQTLRFAGSFRYERNAVEYGSSPTLAAIGVANAGTLHKDAYHFDGAALYRFGSNYLLAGGGFYFGKGSELQAIDGSTGSFATHGYSAYLQLGHVFALLGAAEDVSLKRAITKAPPAAASRFSVGLDVSAGVGYGEETIDGFTDSTGFIWGDERRKAGEVGGQATLFARVPYSDGSLWFPYVGGSVQQRFSYSHTLSFADQAALPGGDTIGFAEAKTFWGTQGGVDVRIRNGWMVGAKGFYTASSDTSIAGGTAYLRIPFSYASR